MLLLFILQGFLGDDEIPVFEIYLFSQDLNEDAPGSPGIADLPSAHRVFVDLEQLLYHILHSEEVEVSAAFTLY